ncbi:hypothetical protein BTA51_23255 [Hahella sp. CCB-MM4]|nr:hypothetical protein BTA51_23255 [Hahella sp. CCB-MM4]
MPFNERNSHSIARLLKRLPQESALRVREWLKLVEQNRLRPMVTKLKAVNDYFNALAYISDEEMWQVEDYWATPLEVISNGKGDCEDLAIAKYFTLRAMGVSSQQLGISYVKSYRLPTAHMVLDYYDSRESRPVTLDNLDDTIRERPDLNAIYSFNEEHVWSSHNRSSNVGSPSEIRHWLLLQEKLSDQLLF